MRRMALIGFLLSLVFAVSACSKPPSKSAYSGRYSGSVSHKLKTQEKRAEAQKASAREAAHPAPREGESVIDQASREPPPPEPKREPVRLVQAASDQPESPQKPPPVEPEEDGETDRRYVALNFDNADVYDFIQSISEITGIDYIMAPGVGGRITVKTSGKIPVKDVLKLMDTILEVYKLAAVKTGNIYKVVPIEQVKKVGPEVRVGAEAAEVPLEDRVIVQIVKLNYLSPARAVEVLQPFFSVHGEVVTFPLMNLLVIIDSAASVRRLLGLVSIFDVDLFKNLGVKLYPVHHIVPSDLAKELKEVFAALGIGDLAAGGGLEAISFDRLNSLLLVASTPSLLQSAESWLKELDRPSEELGIQTHVYYVENGQATNIAGILNQLYVSAEKKPTRPAASPAARKPRTRVREGKKPKAPPRKSRVPQTPRLAALITGEIKIVADEATNALIIQAAPRDYKIIEKTVKELDLRAKQVLIEVLIAEVTLTKGLDFGVQWTLGHANRNRNTAGAAKSLFTTPTGSITDISQFRDFFTGLAAGLPGFTYSLTSGDEVFLLLDALATVTDVDILSSPNILASDNKEAKINVGDEVPIVTSEQLPVGAEQTRFRNIQYRQTGVTLTVTPHVNSKNLVTIDIKQEVSEVAAVGGTDVEAQTPTITTRNAETTVVVQDGQTILLGGLISRNKQRVESRVPLLADIPVVGRLFKTTSDSYRRRELILLITPRVISNDEEAEKLTSEFSGRIESLKRRMRELRRGKR
jgi:general secretion pathway protein D